MNNNLNPVYYVISSDNIEAVKKYIAEGGDVNIELGNESLISRAITCKKKDIVNFLLSNDFINLKDVCLNELVRGNFIESYTDIHKFSKSQISKAITFAACNNKPKSLRVLLTHEKADVNVIDEYGHTVLDESLRLKKISSIRVLLEGDTLNFEQKQCLRSYFMSIGFIDLAISIPKPSLLQRIFA